MLCIAGTDGRFLHVNPAFSVVLGRSAEELQSESFLDLIHDDDRESTVQELGSLRSGKETLGFENRFRHADGSYRRLRWSATPSEDGNLVYATANDVTELCDIKADLARSQRVLHHAAHNALLGGWEFDLRTGKTTWSEQVYRIHETPAGYMPRSLDDSLNFYPPLSRMLIQAAVQHTTATGTGWDIECRFVSARGREKWVRTTGEGVRDADGKIIQLRGAFQDITERREREHLHREFLSTISHEVQAPLSSVVAALRIAAADANHEGATTERNELLALALRNSERLARIVDELIDGEAVVDGHIQLAARSVCTQHVVERTVEQTCLIGEVESTRIEVKEDLVTKVLGDERRIIQALTELVCNAVRHAVSERVTIRVSEKDGAALFEVTDDGPFGERAEGYTTQPVSAMTRAPGRLRSGLEVARRLIELQGGSVGAHALGASGSVFWFTLPTAPTTASR